MFPDNNPHSIQYRAALYLAYIQKGADPKIALQKAKEAQALFAEDVKAELAALEKARARHKEIVGDVEPPPGS